MSGAARDSHALTMSSAIAISGLSPVKTLNKSLLSSSYDPVSTSPFLRKQLNRPTPLRFLHNDMTLSQYEFPAAPSGSALHSAPAPVYVVPSSVRQRAGRRSHLPSPTPRRARPTLARSSSVDSIYRQTRATSRGNSRASSRDAKTRTHSSSNAKNAGYKPAGRVTPKEGSRVSDSASSGQTGAVRRRQTSGKPFHLQPLLTPSTRSRGDRIRAFPVSFRPPVQRRAQVRKSASQVDFSSAIPAAASRPLYSKSVDSFNTAAARSEHVVPSKTRGDWTGGVTSEPRASGVATQKMVNELGFTTILAKADLAALSSKQNRFSLQRIEERLWKSSRDMKKSGGVLASITPSFNTVASRGRLETRILHAHPSRASPISAPSLRLNTASLFTLLTCLV